MSKRKRHVFNEKMRAIREAPRDTARSRDLVSPAREPRYDEVYAAEVSWLETIAGKPLRR